MRAQVVSAGLGLWLMAAPAVLDYGGLAARHGWILGPVIAAVSWIAVSEATRGVRWLNLPCAVYLLIVPFGPGYPLAALVNNLVVGLLVSALTFVRVRSNRQLGGGWRALWHTTGPTGESGRSV